MAREQRRGQRPYSHDDRRDEPHDYSSDRDEWRLKRDKILTTVAIGIIAVVLIAAIATDLRDPYTVGALLAGAFGLLGGPYVIRADERSHDRRRDGDD